MAEVFRTDTVFSTTDELSVKLREIISNLRGAQRVAKSLQETLQGLRVGRIGLPTASEFRASGEAAGRAYAEGFAQAANAGVRRAGRDMAAAMGAVGASAGMAAARGGGNMLMLGGGNGGNNAGPPRSPFSALPAPSGPGGGSNLPAALAPGLGGRPGYGGRGTMGATFAAGALGLTAGRGSGGGNTGGGNTLGFMAGGAVMMHAGEGLLHAGAGIAESGMEYTSAVANLRAQGLTDDEMSSAVTKAWQGSKAVPTSNVTQNVRTLGELRYALGTAEHAEMALDGVNRMAAVLSAFSDGKMGSDQAYKGARALEMANRANTTENFEAGMANMTRSIVAGGGKLNADHFLGFMQQAGTQNTSSMSDDFLYEYMPRVMQTMGGMRSGTGYAALMRQFVGGTASKKSLEAMAQAGLLTHGANSIVGKGVTTRLEAGGLRDAALASSNFYEYLQKDVAPQMVNMTDAQRKAFMGRLFSTGPAAREAAEMLLQGRVLGGGANSGFERDARIVRTIKNGTYEELLNSSPAVMMAAFTAQWKSFTTALGVTIIPIIVPALRSLTAALTSATEWARANPEAVQQILRIGGALGTAMVAVGVFAVGIGTLAALFTLGTPIGAIALFTGAIAGLIFYFRTSVGIVEAFGRLRDVFFEVGNAAVEFGINMRHLVSLLTLGAVSEPPEWTQGSGEHHNGPTRGGVGGPHAPPQQLTPEEQRNTGTGMFQPTAYYPNAARNNMPLITNIIQIDGRTVSRAMMRHLADELDSPNGGGNGFDHRVSPRLPSERIDV